MHVSLPRRYHRVGRSMRFLLWICFGLLAVVPWQAIRGQDQAEKPVVDQSADTKNWESEGDQAEQSVDQSPLDEKPKPIPSAAPKQVSQDPDPSLIVRGQDAPLQMSPIQISPGMQGPEVEDPGFLASDRITGRSGQALGSLFRIGGFTGPAIGRKNALFPLEYMPYSLVDNNLIFADVRGFKSSTDTFGMNLGGGYRRYIPQLDRIFGVNAFFDYDNTSGSTFRQVGFGAEWLGAMYDLRGNAYLPTGPSSQQTSLVNVDGTQNFVGHFLTVDRLHTFNNSLHGFDGEIGVPIPHPVAERHDVRVFGGGYWYESNLIQSFGGWKTRIQANVIPSVSLQLEVTHDQQFKTNVVFGGSWSYGGFKQSPGTPKSQYDRMTTPVIRNYNIIVGTAYQKDIGKVVDDPNTGNPYFFEFVNTNAVVPNFPLPFPTTGTGNGTFETPFTVFKDAQNAMNFSQPLPVPPDTLRGIIFVEGNSTFNNTIGPIVLQDNVRVLGGSAGVEHVVNTDGLNSNSALGTLLLLPKDPGTNKPQFNNTPADPITNASFTLGNYSEFSGFTVKNPAGIGIYAPGITGSSHYSTVRQTDVTGAGSNSVWLNGTQGRILFQGDNITSSGTTPADTFLVTGTVGSVIFTSDPLTAVNAPTLGTITNNDVTAAGTASYALDVQTTTATGNVSFLNSYPGQNAKTGILITDTGASGIQILNNNGYVAIGNATLTNNIGNALAVIGEVGTFSSSGALNITNSAANSILVTGLGATGKVLFPGTGANPFDVNITNPVGNGILLTGNAGTIAFSTGVSINNGNASNDIVYQGNTAANSTSFNNITINGGGTGILIGALAPPNTNGNFSVTGTTVITGTSGIGINIMNNPAASIVQFGTGSAGGGTTINTPGGIGINVMNNAGTVNFGSTTAINQPAFNAVGALPIFPAINIQGNNTLTSSVTFAYANIVGGNVPVLPLVANAQQYGVNIGDPANPLLYNKAPVTFNRLDITGLQNGVGLWVNHEGVPPIAATNGAPAVPGDGLNIISGHILTAGGEAAVEIRNSTINVTLNSVTAGPSVTTNLNYGINLLNDTSVVTTTLPQLNQFMFTLGALANASQTSGGVITGAKIAGINVVQNQANVPPLPNLVQTGAVSINSVTLQNNQIGLSATNLLQLSVNNADFTNNIGGGLGNVGTRPVAVPTDTGAGIDAVNIPRVDVEHSNFTFNGTLFQDHAIYLHATTPLVQPGISGVPLSNNGTATGGKYVWSINNNINQNNFVGGFIGAPFTGDVVLVSGPANQNLQYFAPPSGNPNLPVNILPVPLVFQFNNNLITVPNNNLGLVNNPIPSFGAVDVKWTGQIDPASSVANVVSSMSYNTVNLGGGDYAFAVQNQTAIYSTNFVIANNTVQANNGGNIGVFVNDLSQTNLTIDNNSFNFLTAPVNGNVTFADYGMSISVANTNGAGNFSQMDISYNKITMAQGPLNQGILFPTMAPPASITFNGNNIKITGAQPIFGQGIQFQVINGAPVVLHGSVNNIISVNNNGAGIVPRNWFDPIPSPSTQGQFIINGAFGP